MKEIKLHTIQEAIKQLKETKKEKFDSSVELHINLKLDVTQSDQQIRFSVTLPNGTGKTQKVAVLASKTIQGADLQLSETDIDEIATGKLRPKVDFDVIVAEPRYMAKLAKAAKILGPAGCMPNPKTGTVTEDVEKAVAQFKKGKVEVRTEKDTPVIHTIIGKVSFTEDNLLQNFDELYASLKQHRPSKAKPDWLKSMYICSTMGKSYQIDFSTL